MAISQVNQVWEIDITYIPMAKGFMYLTAIIDVYSRFVVGWDISNSLQPSGNACVGGALWAATNHELRPGSSVKSG
ncbi:MAG: DDE-type integrase/transposase/recombinase [Haliscomenobacter sp.]